MAQGNLVLPTVGVVSGLTMVGDINVAVLALTTQNSGASAPTNSTGGAPILGQLWLDTTSATAPILKQYTGSAWVVIATLDVTNGIWTPPIGGGVATTLASGTTTDLGSKANAFLTVSGVTTITGLGSSAVVNSIHIVTFSGILTLTHSGTSLILPTGANITTAAGDVAAFVYLGSGNWRCLFYQKASGAPLSTAATGAAQLIASSQGMNAVLNLRLNATVGASALTLAIKGADGNDPSASNPVLIPFRDATLANGDPIISSLQAALSFTVASTNTLGTSSGNIAFRLWVIAYYNGGTVAVGLFNASTATQIFGLSEGDLVSTAASTNGGSSAGTHYANVSTITNTPYRILGYLEWGSGLATAGTWASAPTKIVLFGPGIKKPGDVIQLVSTFTGAVATGSTAIPNDDTIPQITEGNEYMTQAITPASPANILRIMASANVVHSVANNSVAVALFQDAIANALSVASYISINGNQDQPIIITYIMVAATSSSTTFRIRAGGSGATLTFNGSASARKYGGVFNSYMIVEEIMG